MAHTHDHRKHGKASARPQYKYPDALKRIETRRGTPNWKLLTSTVHAHIREQRFSQRLARRVERRVRASNTEIRKSLRASGTLRARDVQRVTTKIRVSRTAMWRSIADILEAETRAFQRAEMRAELRRLRRALEGWSQQDEISEDDFDFEEQRDLPEILPGVSLKNWIASLIGADILWIQSAVRRVYQYDNTASSVDYEEALFGRLRSKGGGRMGGPASRTITNARAVARTTVTATSNEARTTIHEAYPRLIVSELWVSIIDSVTSMICRDLDGQVFRLRTGPRPPLHINCRSLRVAVFGGEAFSSASDLGVADTLSFSEWLVDQPDEVQNDILGEERAQMFRDGEDLSEFVDITGMEYTLNELFA